MFHAELRRFPHVARAFNLSAEELDARIVMPLVRGIPVDLDDRQWPSEKTRLTIYEAPEVAAEDRGLGRGWSLVTREGEDVTTTLLDAARARLQEASPEGAVAALKPRLLAAVDGAPTALSAAVAIAERALPGRRASEALAVAEQAVWELLHAGELTLVSDGDAVPEAEWAALLLSWESWAYQAEDSSSTSTVAIAAMQNR